MSKKEKDKTSVIADDPPKVEKQSAKGGQTTIRMERSAEDAASATGGGPLTADVHPDEVVNFEKTGWKKAK